MTESLKSIMESIMGAWVGGWGPDAHVFRVRDGPSPLAGLDRLIFAA